MRTGYAIPTLAEMHMKWSAILTDRFGADICLRFELNEWLLQKDSTGFGIIWEQFKVI